MKVLHDCEEWPRYQAIYNPNQWPESMSQNTGILSCGVLFSYSMIRSACCHSVSREGTPQKEKQAVQYFRGFSNAVWPAPKDPLCSLLTTCYSFHQTTSYHKVTSEYSATWFLLLHNFRSPWHLCSNFTSGLLSHVFSATVSTSGSNGIGCSILSEFPTWKTWL